MGIDAVRSSRLGLALTWVLILVGLYLSSWYSYLLFHTLAELFSIIVALGVFVIFWNARPSVDNSYFLFLGISYLFIAVLDLVHTLAYPGMSVIQGSDTNLAAQLWIAARYVQSISLLIAPLFLVRKLRGIPVVVGYGLGTALILGTILYGRIFPVCFVEGQGLTPFKVFSEYVISLFFLASLVLLYRKRTEFDAHVLQLLVASTMVAIASELAFTRYANAYGSANLIGHLLKIASFYLVYRAVVVTGLVRPYDLLFRNLKQEQEALRESEERYRHLVEDIDDVIYSVDAQGKVTYVSPAIESWLGYAPAEIVGRELSALVHPDDLRLAGDGLQRVLSGQTDRVNEYRTLTKSGRLRSARTSARPVMADGRIVGARGVLTDITDEARAEEVLRQYADEAATRVRHLNCLYGISALVEKPGITLEQILQGVVELIPIAWSYPKITCARLNVGSLRFETNKYRRTAWQQTAEIAIHSEQVGSVRVCYLEERPELDEGPFSREERRLIEAIAERVGRIAERKRAQERLVEAKEAAENAQRVAEERRRETERRREVAESLADVMSVLNSNQTLDEVLDYITSQAGRLLDNHAVAIYKLEDEGKLSVRAAQGLELTYVVGQEVPIGRQALEQAIASGQAITVSNLRSSLLGEQELLPETEGEAISSTRDHLYQALLTAPITMGDDPYGGIVLYYVEPREFTKEEIELATVFADQIGLAIENARLRDQVGEAAAIAERERLAGDLHDAVTQTLFSAALIAETLPRIWERDPERGREGLQELRELTQGALAEMRTLLLELRPAALTEKPLGDLLSHLATAVTSRGRVPVKLTVAGDSSLPPETQIGLYRIAQEALNNMIKHAKASEAFVDLECEPGRAMLSIRDDGCGFDPADVKPAHLGLDIMRERAETMGATLEVFSDLGQGTQIKVVWTETARGRSYE
jgi:PAS domain S-box-containing protein